MVKKVGIITINDYNNYGNRLQNYATQEILISLGCEVETIVTKPQKNKKMIEKIRTVKIKQIIRLMIRLMKKIRLKIYKTKKELENNSLVATRNNRFIQFTKDNIKETDYYIKTTDSPFYLDEKYDYFVVGSDQVWNPNFRGTNPVDFLTFASLNKRIAFAPSFGISELPKKYSEKYSSWLTDMKHISVREETGAKIIKQLVNRDVEVIIDPTLVLEKENWLKMCDKSNININSPYLLTYFLGEATEEKSNWINNVAEINNLVVINLANIEDKKYFSIDPIDFINMIKNCSIFCTDSFHGVVFSILFEKPFIVFNRISQTQPMNSRIDTILSKFHLKDRMWNGKSYEDCMSIDYSHITPILEEERKKAIDFLRNSLNIKDE